jgi:hypothetical protein
MRIKFPNRVEFPNAPSGFSHLLYVFNGLGVTALGDLWINAHVWIGDQHLSSRPRKQRQSPPSVGQWTPK